MSTYTRARTQDVHSGVFIGDRDRLQDVDAKAVCQAGEFVGQCNIASNRIGEIVVDNECRTGVAGVFACGDVTNVPYKQVVVAAGEGAKAALSAYNYLISQR